MFLQHYLVNFKKKKKCSTICLPHPMSRSWPYHKGLYKQLTWKCLTQCLTTSCSGGLVRLGNIAVIHHNNGHAAGNAVLIVLRLHAATTTCSTYSTIWIWVVSNFSVSGQTPKISLQKLFFFLSAEKPAIYMLLAACSSGRREAWWYEKSLVSGRTKKME